MKTTELHDSGNRNVRNIRCRLKLSVDGEKRTEEEGQPITYNCYSISTFKNGLNIPNKGNCSKIGSSLNINDATY